MPPDPNITTIREALLPKDEHHPHCASRRTGRACDCYYGRRKDGMVAHDAADAVGRELADLRAENERLAFEHGVAWEQGQDAERRLHEATEALAYYAERRNYRTSGGSRCEQHGGMWCGMEHSDAWDGGPGARARAALAAVEGTAATPDEKCQHTNARVEFRDPVRGQISPDPRTYGQWLVCMDCGHERRAVFADPRETTT